MFAPCGHLLQPAVLCHQRHITRVNPDRHPDGLILLRQSQRPRRIRQIRRRHDDPSHPGRLRPRDDIVYIPGETLAR